MPRQLTEHGKNYINEYNKTKYSQIVIRFKKNAEDEQNIFLHLKKQANQAEYIKNLIKRDMTENAVHSM